MFRWTRTLTFVFAFMSPVAFADASCAVGSVKLVAEGKSELLAARFESQTEVLAQLKELSAKLGGLLGVEAAHAPRFKEFRRFSVGRSGPSYAGYWVNARSERLGDVQFHIAMAPQESCKLQALSLDYAN
jgi:hypothetical protein